MVRTGSGTLQTSMCPTIAPLKSQGLIVSYRVEPCFVFIYKILEAQLDEAVGLKIQSVLVLAFPDYSYAMIDQANRRIDMLQCAHFHEGLPNVSIPGAGRGERKLGTISKRKAVMHQDNAVIAQNLNAMEQVASYLGVLMQAVNKNNIEF